MKLARILPVVALALTAALQGVSRASAEEGDGCNNTSGYYYATPCANTVYTYYYVTVYCNGQYMGTQFYLVSVDPAPCPPPTQRGEDDPQIPGGP